MTRDRNLKRDVRKQATASGVRYTRALADRRLVEDQRRYYELRAPEYGDVAHSDRSGGGDATRTLSDGRQYDIVKVFWRPTELEERLRSLGWAVTVGRVGETYLLGHGKPAHQRSMYGRGRWAER